MIKINKISKSFGEHLLMDSISLDIDNKDFLVLLGPSGCGKTTLLRIIAGLEKPDTGEIYFDNIDITHLLTQKRNISFVFQDFALYPHYSVEDNISYPLKIKGLGKQEIKEKTQAVANKVQLNDLLKRNVQKLSSGEKQRVSIARALVKKPDLLLLDEPLSNVDPKLKLEMKILIKEVLGTINIPVIYVTHDQEEAFSIGNKVAILEGGYIHQIGTHEEIVNKPEDLFVSEFIKIPPNNIFRYCKIDEKIVISSYRNEDKKIKLKKEFFPENNILFAVSSIDLSYRLTNEKSKNINDVLIVQGEFLFSENFGTSFISYFKTELGILSVLTKNKNLDNDLPYYLTISMKKINKFDTKTSRRIDL